MKLGVFVFVLFFLKTNWGIERGCVGFYENDCFTEKKSWYLYIDATTPSHFCENKDVYGECHV